MFHDTHTFGAIHVVPNWRVADESARLALTVTADDEGKVVWQEDDNSLWLLTDGTTPIWTQIAGAGSAFVSPPVTLSDPGTPGQYSCDGSYAYLCYATDTWAKWPVTT